MIVTRMKISDTVTTTVMIRACLAGSPGTAGEGDNVEADLMVVVEKILAVDKGDVRGVSTVEGSDEVGVVMEGGEGRV